MTTDSHTDTTMPTDHESHTTTDHDAIREWAEARDGHPAHVPDTGDGDAGLLRIEFEDGSDEELERISWDAFFDTFDEKNLAFLYQETTKDGGTSRFFKIVDRSTADAASG